MAWTAHSTSDPLREVMNKFNANHTALASLHYGATAPPLPSVWMLWFDSSTGDIKQRQPDNTWKAIWNIAQTIIDPKFGVFVPSFGQRVRTGWTPVSVTANLSYTYVTAYTGAPVPVLHSTSLLFFKAGTAIIQRRLFAREIQAPLQLSGLILCEFYTDGFRLTNATPGDTYGTPQVSIDSVVVEGTQ
ncbi:MAG: hypothetical protein AB7H92_18880 [Microbacteriaceae bacterium]